MSLLKGRMPKTYYEVKKFLKHQKEMDALYQEQLALNKGKQVQYWNWWPDERTAYWLEQFMLNRGLLDNTNKIIALCSVFGEREVLEGVKADVRIFFSGENLHNPRHAQYADYMLSGSNPFDFAMGFDEFENERYLRFPLWIIFLFEPDATEDDIRNRCEELNHPEISNKQEFCSLVARADWYGIRTQIYEVLSSIGKVDCPSDLLHNDDRMKTIYGDDKRAYLTQYRFNICPENTSAHGYVTEKLFESMVCGCVPIYWGTENLDIINPDVVLRWKKNARNEELLQKIQELNADEKKYKYFASQPRLIDNAAGYVIGEFEALEKQLKKLL